MNRFILMLLLIFPVTSMAYCFNEAGSFYRISPVLLKSIAEHESRMNPNLVMKNKNGTIDVGLMGINSSNFKELAEKGINPSELKNPCVNVVAGAYLLAKKVVQHGYTWDAVGAYHSETPVFKARYRELIQKKVAKNIHG